MNMKKAISDYIDSCKDSMISDLRGLVQIPSVMGKADENAPFGKYPAKALEAALKLCKANGLYTRNIDNYVGTADLFDGRENHLGILCHLDVVPEGSGWSVPPFDITERDGRLFGRGAIDDKGPFIAALYAVKAVKEMGFTVDKNVRLIMGTNEENGSADLTYYRKKEALPPLLFTPDGSYPVINIEKGMLRISLSAKHSPEIVSLTAGNAVNAVPESAEAIICGRSAAEISEAAKKLRLTAKIEITDLKDTIKITVKGKSAHASTPETGENALTALLALFAGLGFSEGKAFAAMFPCGETDGFSAGIKCSDEASGAVTAVLSTAEIKGSDIICRGDIRFPVSESCKSIISRMEKTAEAHGMIFSADMSSEPHIVPAESGFIRSLLEVYEEYTGKKGYTVAIGGGTYVHDTENGVAFGAEFPGEDNHMHGADEFITAESLLLNAKIYAGAILKLCCRQNAANP